MGLVEWALGVQHGLERFPDKELGEWELGLE